MHATLSRAFLRIFSQCTHACTHNKYGGARTVVEVQLMMMMIIMGWFICAVDEQWMIVM